MARTYSPLRYPGGKHVLAATLKRLIDQAGAAGGTYIEPYAGGAGAALTLLFDEHVNRIVINDADRSVYAFWWSVLNRTDEFANLVKTTPLTIAEWRRQRNVYKHPRHSPLLQRGFAAFFLNRCNRSGIISTGGPIGGIKQKGEWRIGARFNRSDLISRIWRVAEFGERIEISNLDALDFLRKRVEIIKPESKPFVYLDPPYFVNGHQLYMNHYHSDDHQQLAKYVLTKLHHPWAMTYDNVSVIRKLYPAMRVVPFTINYSARERKTGSEILIVNPRLSLPSNWRVFDTKAS